MDMIIKNVKRVELIAKILSVDLRWFNIIQMFMFQKKLSKKV